MSGIHTNTNQRGSALIMTIVVLLAVTALGLTMTTISKDQIDMATNLKVKEIARFNCDSCTVTVGKLIRHVVDQSNEGIVGIVEGTPLAPGISYAPPVTAATPDVEFANKVLFELETGGCEDLSLNTQAIANAVTAASGGALTISTAVNPVTGNPIELDAAADLRTDLSSISGEAGSASNEHMGGTSAGAGPSGHGAVLRFVYACRGRAPYEALHVAYSVYDKPLPR